MSGTEWLECESVEKNNASVPELHSFWANHTVGSSPWLSLLNGSSQCRFTTVGAVDMGLRIFVDPYVGLDLAIGGEDEKLYSAGANAERKSRREAQGVGGSGNWRKADY